MNTREEAFEHGRACGEAINQSDQSRYTFQRDWFRRAIAGKPNEAELRAGFDAGYKEVRESNIRFRNLSARW